MGSTLSQQDIQDIIERVRRRLGEAGPTGAGLRGAAEVSASAEAELGDGIFPTIDEAVEAAREAFEEYRRFHIETQELTSAQQDARSRALQAVYQAEEARRATDTFRELAHRDALGIPPNTAKSREKHLRIPSDNHVRASRIVILRRRCLRLLRGYAADVGDIVLQLFGRQTVQRQCRDLTSEPRRRFDCSSE